MVVFFLLEREIQIQPWFECVCVRFCMGTYLGRERFVRCLEPEQRVTTEI